MISRFFWRSAFQAIRSPAALFSHFAYDVSSMMRSPGMAGSRRSFVRKVEHPVLTAGHDLQRIRCFDACGGA